MRLRTVDLGLHAARELDVPMPLASITRDQVQALIGLGSATRTSTS